ncbi:MAG: Stp1/IreP family PP2C-type Ser/Thr phosphatase, partial [Myxococcota bacterium]
MLVQSFGATDVGKKRKLNEDSFLVDDDIGVYIVADGMGGHAAGEVASSMAVRIIHEELQNRCEKMRNALATGSIEARNEALQEVSRAIGTACSEIFAVASADETKQGMGTTIVLLFIFGEEAIVAHVGDSRVYLMRDGQCYQLTEDHSLIQEQLRRGMITAEEAKRVTYSNVITKALGIQEGVQSDTLYVELMPGDEFLLCSDGLHGYFTDDELPKIIGGQDIDAAVGRCIETALERGGKDNITVIDVRMVDDRRQPQGVTASSKIEALRNIPLFRHLEYKELVQVLNIISIRPAAAGDVIISEGDQGDELFILLTGSVTVSKNGNVLAQLKPYKHFGEMALVDKEPRSATVTADSLSKLIVINRKDF